MQLEIPKFPFDSEVEDVITIAGTTVVTIGVMNDMGRCRATAFHFFPFDARLICPDE